MDIIHLVRRLVERVHASVGGTFVSCVEPHGTVHASTGKARAWAEVRLLSHVCVLCSDRG